MNIEKYKNADVYGIYCDVEVNPLDPEFNDYQMAVVWDDYVYRDKDKFIDELKSCLEEENDSEKLEKVIKYDSLTCQVEKDIFIEELCEELNLSDRCIYTYYYEMRSTLVGIALSLEDAIEMVDIIDKRLNPIHYRLIHSDLKGYKQLKEVCEILTKLNEAGIKNV